MIGPPMLQGAYLSIAEARTSEQFRERVIRFARERGFDTVCAIANSIIFTKSRSQPQLLRRKFS
jgi:acetolactate synthase regulatory subunit